MKDEVEWDGGGIDKKRGRKPAERVLWSFDPCRNVSFRHSSTVGMQCGLEVRTDLYDSYTHAGRCMKV